MHPPIKACSFLSVSDVLSSHLTTQGEQDQFWKLYLDGLPISWTDLLQEVRAIGRLEGLYVDLES